MLRRQYQSDPDNPEAWLRYRSFLRRLQDASRLPFFDDLETWTALTETQQDAAVGELQQALEDDYEFLSIDHFECNSQRTRLASFRHKRCGLLMRAIPGQSQKNIPPLLVSATAIDLHHWQRLPNAPAAEASLPHSPVVSFPVTILKWLSEALGGLRLPYLEEWRYIAQAGSPDDYFWGQDMDPDYCWFVGNSGLRPQSTQSHLEARRWNAFGLCDTYGLTHELCLTNSPELGTHSYTETFPTRTSERRVLFRAAGGDSNSTAEDCRRDAFGVPYLNGPRMPSGFRPVRRIPTQRGPFARVHGSGQYNAGSHTSIRGFGKSMKDRKIPIVIWDLGEVDYVNSFALGSFVRLADDLRQLGGALCLTRVPDKIQVIIEMLGLDHFLSCFENHQQATSFLANAQLSNLSFGTEYTICWPPKRHPLPDHPKPFPGFVASNEDVLDPDSESDTE